MAQQPAVAFRPPKIQDNPAGWGPVSVPEDFKDIPYQPFSKSDRIGKVSDWTGGTYTDRRYANRYSSQYGAGGAAFSYYHEEDESSFHLVDSSRQPSRPKFGQQRRFQQQNQRRPQQQNPRRTERRGMQKLGGGQGGRQFHRRRDDRQQRVREASIEVRSDWKLLEEIELARLAKLNFGVSDPDDVMMCGAVEYYDKSYDRVNTKLERPLAKVDRVYHTVTTSDDPIIRQLSSEGGRVFATDAILATLMACPRSVYSWDIVVTRVGDKVFFDKREGSTFDLLTVNETAQDPPTDEADAINTPASLALEATYINRNFVQQVLKREGKTFEHPNPFVSEGEEAPSVAYKYRKWDLGSDIGLVARCELDAAFWKKENTDEGLMMIKALNEYDPKTSSNSVDWRQKLDTQKGAVLATELKNNSFKLAKWTASALLGGADQLKLGYVSRNNRKNHTSHVILGTQGFNPGELATQINFNMNNAWGILRMFVDTVLALPEGKYLILKDPNKAVVRIYEVPEDAFDQTDSEGDDEGDNVGQ